MDRSKVGAHPHFVAANPSRSGIDYRQDALMQPTTPGRPWIGCRPKVVCRIVNWDVQLITKKARRRCPARLLQVGMVLNPRLKPVRI